MQHIHTTHYHRKRQSVNIALPVGHLTAGNAAPANPRLHPCGLTWSKALQDAAVCLQNANAQLVVVVQPVVISIVVGLQHTAQQLRQHYCNTQGWGLSCAAHDVMQKQSVLVNYTLLACIGA